MEVIKFKKKKKPITREKINLDKIRRKLIVAQDILWTLVAIVLLIALLKALF